MPKQVRSARGVILDFDTIIIKQQLAQAPMNIEVARRKEFIDSKEGKTRGSKQTEDAAALVETTKSEVAQEVDAELAVDASAKSIKKSTKTTK